MVGVAALDNVSAVLAEKLFFVDTSSHFCERNPATYQFNRLVGYSPAFTYSVSDPVLFAPLGRRTAVNIKFFCHLAWAFLLPHKSTPKFLWLHSPPRRN
jgi:hypothetical protein